MWHTFKENVETWTEAIELSDLGGKKLCNTTNEFP